MPGAGVPRHEKAEKAHSIRQHSEIVITTPWRRSCVSVLLGSIGRRLVAQSLAMTPALQDFVPKLLEDYVRALLISVLSIKIN